MPSASRARRPAGTTKARSGAPHRRPRSRWERRRRRIAWVAAISLTVVLAGAAAATVIGSSSGNGSRSGSPSSGATLVARTLVHLPAASATAVVGGIGYATDDVHDQLVRFDPRTGRVDGSVHLSGRPTALVALGRELWVADTLDNQLVEIDAATLRVRRSVRVPAGPAALAVLGDTVWVASPTAGAVTPVEGRSGTSGTPLAVAAGVVRVAVGFGALWATGTSDQLTRIEPAPGGVGAPTQRAVYVGQGPIGVATGAGSVWVADARGGSVAQVDPATMAVTQHRQLGDDPLTVAVAGGRVYVGFGSPRTLRVVAPSPVSEALHLGASPRSLLPVGSGVWVATSNPARVVAVAASLSDSGNGSAATVVSLGCAARNPMPFAGPMSIVSYRTDVSLPEPPCRSLPAGPMSFRKR